MIERKQFIVHGGETAADGKPTWPIYLRVEMSKREALRLLQDIANGLDSDYDSVELALFGELKNIEED